MYIDYICTYKKNNTGIYVVHAHEVCNQSMSISRFNYKHTVVSLETFFFILYCHQSFQLQSEVKRNQFIEVFRLVVQIE